MTVVSRWRCPDCDESFYEYTVTKLPDGPIVNSYRPEDLAKAWQEHAAQKGCRRQQPPAEPSVVEVPAA